MEKVVFRADKENPVEFFVLPPKRGALLFVLLFFLECHFLF